MRWDAQWKVCVSNNYIVVTEILISSKCRKSHSSFRFLCNFNLQLHHLPFLDLILSFSWWGWRGTLVEALASNYIRFDKYRHRDKFGVVAFSARTNLFRLQFANKPAIYTFYTSANRTSCNIPSISCVIDRLSAPDRLSHYTPRLLAAAGDVERQTAVSWVTSNVQHHHHLWNNEYKPQGQVFRPCKYNSYPLCNNDGQFWFGRKVVWSDLGDSLNLILNYCIGDWVLHPQAACLVWTSNENNDTVSMCSLPCQNIPGFLNSVKDVPYLHLKTLNIGSRGTVAVFKHFSEICSRPKLHFKLQWMYTSKTAKTNTLNWT